MTLPADFTLAESGFQRVGAATQIDVDPIYICFKNGSVIYNIIIYIYTNCIYGIGTRNSTGTCYMTIDGLHNYNDDQKKLIFMFFIG